MQPVPQNPAPNPEFSRRFPRLDEPPTTRQLLLRTGRIAALTPVLVLAMLLTTPLATASQTVSQTVSQTAAPGPGMNPIQLAGLQMVRSARMAPDGSAVAFVREVPRRLLDEEDGPSWTELHVVTTFTGRTAVNGRTAATGKTTPFITGQTEISAVEWLPDSSAISFLTRRGTDTTRCLYMIPADGGEARLLVALDTDIRAYSWSPDSRQVALVATAPKADELDELEKNGFTQHVFEEDWRPLQVWIADRSSNDARATASTSDPSPGEPRSLALDGSAFAVRWSPDGAALAVALAPRPLVDDRYMLQRISVVDVASGQVLAKVQNPGKLATFEWSPDGLHLVLLSGADLHDPAAGSLLVVGRGGGMPVNLTGERECTVNAVAWKDAETLVWIASEGVETHLWTGRLDGTDARRLPDPAPGATPTRLSLDRAGTLAAYIADSPQYPSELFIGPLGAQAERRTTSNPRLDQVELARQEVIRYPARDGLEIEGILLYPLGFEQGTRYPLVVIVHGGPESHHHNGWMTRYSGPAQILAARGFLVLYPNYRGSTGRGVAFSKLGQNDAAGHEFDDLVDGVDHLVKLGLADPEKVGMTGGSYGGYATAWCATRYTDRFAAGVMFAGISDKLSKTGTTDIPQEELLVHARELPHQNLEHFIERSPIAHAEGAHTPLLIAHGTADPRVHPGQALEMYRALATAGTAPVRLVLYPGEGHGNRRAASRFDLCLRLLRWFDHYLKGPGGEPPPYPLDYRAPANGWAETAERS